MTREKINIKIKPFGFLDLLAFKKLVPTRKKKIATAEVTPVSEKPPVNVLAARLHPEVQHLIVSEIREETGNVKTYKLVADAAGGTEQLAYFRPGQYLSLEFAIDGSTVTRPYSIASSPQDSLQGYYEITVKKDDGGYISNYIHEHWSAGSAVKASGPQGHFYHDNLRDKNNLVAIAGGCGVTPFRSMARSIVEGNLPVNLTLFYGSNKKQDIIYLEEMEQLAASSNGAVKIVHILAEEEAEGFEHGFISAALLRKYVNVDDCSFFICGPQAMYEHLSTEIAGLKIRNKFIRRELFGEIKNIKAVKGYPAGAVSENYSVKVHIGSQVKVIDADPSESLLVALERAGLCPPSACRSGSCGVCRSLLISGDLFIPEDVDERRAADKKFGFIHPCVSYPLGDLEIIIPRKKTG